MNKTIPALLVTTIFASQASALNILLTNDDGLTSNTETLYHALEAEGHDVIVSIPCHGQSGMGGAIKFLKPIESLDEACLNNAAPTGAPGIGAVTKEGNYEDFFYVNGTPNMATAYGFDILAKERWDAMPDLVISGPNEGQNLGGIVVNSGTVSNAQYALAHNVPAIALSAGSNSRGEKDANGDHAHNPLSDIVAAQSIKLLELLEDRAEGESLLPEGIALNVNFPNDVTMETPFETSEIGDYQHYLVYFTNDLGADQHAGSFGVSDVHAPGMILATNEAAPTADQNDDESIIYKSAISVSPMQLAYDAPDEVRDWLSKELNAKELASK